MLRKPSKRKKVSAPNPEPIPASAIIHIPLNTNEENYLLIAQYGRLIYDASQTVISMNDYRNEIMKYADRIRYLAAQLREPNGHRRA